MGSNVLQFSLKAKTIEDCHSIILSFRNKWREHIIQGKVRVVFRKVLPTKFAPEWMYAYISQPASGIVAKIQVLDCVRYDFEKAITFAEAGLHTEDELREYAEGCEYLDVMRLGDVLIARKVLTRAMLTDEFEFWPSPSFIPLSRSGSQTLDKIGKFHHIS